MFPADVVEYFRTVSWARTLANPPDQAFAATNRAFERWSARELQKRRAPMRALLQIGTMSVAFALVLAPAGALQQGGGGLASPQQKTDQEKAQHSEPGRAGTTEPSSESQAAKADPSAVFVDGRLAVPGAPADSQTVPSKSSKRNAALDELPTMAFPLQLTDEQRQRIQSAVRNANAPVAQGQTALHAADQLPTAIEARALPQDVTTEIPAVRNRSFVRTADRILLVTPASRIIIGEIPDQQPAN
jgi:hypothetical protein